MHVRTHAQEVLYGRDGDFSSPHRAIDRARQQQHMAHRAGTQAAVANQQPHLMATPEILLRARDSLNV